MVSKAQIRYSLYRPVCLEIHPNLSYCLSLQLSFYVSPPNTELNNFAWEQYISPILLLTLIVVHNPGDLEIFLFTVRIRIHRVKISRN